LLFSIASAFTPAKTRRGLMNQHTRTIIGGGMLIAAFAVLTPTAATADPAGMRKCRVGSVRVYQACRDRVSLERRACVADCLQAPADGIACVAACVDASRADVRACRDGYGSYRSLCADLATLPGDTAACGERLAECATDVAKQMSACQTDALRAESQAAMMSTCAGGAEDDLHECDVEFADCVAASE
jgi:hypothetical protein